MAIKSLFDIFKGINKKFIPYGADKLLNNVTISGTTYTVALNTVKEIGTYYYLGPSGTTTKITGIGNLTTRSFKLIVMKPWNINNSSNDLQQVLITTDFCIYGRSFSTSWSNWRRLDSN